MYSILSQEGVDVRLYIRDDGSSDRTTDMDDVKRQKSQRSALLIYIIVGDIEK